jgi:hypothetical protein
MQLPLHFSSAVLLPHHASPMDLTSPVARLLRTYTYRNFKCRKQLNAHFIAFMAFMAFMARFIAFFAGAASATAAAALAFIAFFMAFMGAIV